MILYNHSEEPQQNAIPETSDRTAALLTFCKTPRTRKEIADFLGISTVYHANKRYIAPLVAQGLLRMSIPEKPQSRNQRFTTVQK